ncbi:MAG TPA: 4-hydroxyphenylpyruvate dioxygenase [Gemmatimonadales bacterium]|nr:4-hydroxyphenylpyruvate dioxygenase [Gemmatimonadales bacterium]
MHTKALAADAASTDTFPINGTDFVEFYVGNAKQASHYYRTAFGFQLVAYRGPETGTRDRATYLMQQNKVRLLLTSPLSPEHPAAAHIAQHGDGVRDIALWVDDARKAFSDAVERGAKPVQKPTVMRDEAGEVVIAAIHTYGDTIHSLVERRNYKGLFLPGFQPVAPRYNPSPVGLQYVDHCVGNVELGAMNTWVSFYQEVMGFRNLISFDDKDISTEYSSLMSKVVASGNDRIKFPINEPAQGRKKSQIDEYLDFYRGPGVQHLAIATDNIIETVTALRDRGVDFLQVPKAYYDSVLDRVGHIDEDLAPLKELGILVDRDDEGYLLQIFSKPVEDRPTLFYEIIQRKGAKSFGKGNFKALFEAIEREQASRGNL